MSSLKIGYSHLVDVLAYPTEAQSYKDWFPSLNLHYGRKSCQASIAAATASTRGLVYDFGQNFSVDFYYIGRADMLLDQGVTSVTLSKSSDNVTYGTVDSQSITVNDLKGRREDDMLFTFSSATDRYWWWQIDGPSAITRYSKFLFGTIFDPEAQPDEMIPLYDAPDAGTHEAESGAEHNAQFSLSRRTFQITWHGVTDAKAKKFLDIKNSTYPGVVLYTSDNHHILRDEGLIYAFMVDVQKTDAQGIGSWNSVTATFVESIG